MKKLNKKQKLIVLSAIIIFIVIIATIITTNVIKTNITNGMYNSSNNSSNNGNLLPQYIKAGITLGGVTGTLEALDTFDATAKPEDIIKGKTAYVKGVKIVGTKFMVNAPKIMPGMTPIKFIEATENSKGYAVDTNIADKDWYDYENKKWANARTEDGSMWVWIPRFAYKLNKETQTTEVVFLVGTSDEYYDENGNKHTAKRCTGTDDFIDTTTGFTVHPAFTDESSIGYRNGGWREELTGIWVSKFEAAYASGGNSVQVKSSSVNYTSETAWGSAIELNSDNDGFISSRNWLDGIYGSNSVSIKYPTFQGSSYSMNYISIGDAYSIARVLTENGNIYGLTSSTDSHMLKNSEWGAVAYLTKSQYGIESTDIALNLKNMNSGNSSNTKDEGNSLASVYAVTGYNDSDKEWNDYLGTSNSASSTGNIYGVYDLSGGALEYTSGYISNGNNRLGDYGSSLTDWINADNYKTTSDEYRVAYKANDIGNTDVDKSNSNYLLNNNNYGEALNEISTQGSGELAWNEDLFNYPSNGSTFMDRGGNYLNGAQAGVFYLGCNNGSPEFRRGFRVVLI